MMGRIEPIFKKGDYKGGKICYFPPLYVSCFNIPSFLDW